MRKSLTRPVYDSYWVKPDKILAGQYPCGPDDTEAQVRFHSLLKAGVTFFPDLTEKGEKHFRPSLLRLPPDTFDTLSSASLIYSEFAISNTSFISLSVAILHTLFRQQLHTML